jgi:hypothetical protein
MRVVLASADLTAFAWAAGSPREDERGAGQWALTRVRASR